MASGFLLSAGLPPGHFTHIILDEAAQMSEPDALVPLCFATNGTRVIMSGDHRQLGPRIRSKKAVNLGLNISLMVMKSSQFFMKIQRNG